MGPLDKYVLAEDSLSATPAGFDLKVYSHWYRSLPVSSIGTLHVKLNGREMEADQIKLALDDKTYSLQTLGDQYEHWWFVLDPIVLHVKEKREKLRMGSEYNIELELGLFIPYVLTGKEEKPLLASSTIMKNLICQ